ncbi:MAG: hypothetical protein IJS02_00085 [Bacteroidales bacterium]|nr:hypothetical protein [Bacteroidales bacterium]
MEISLFSQCLGDALIENDSVNVPGLGCFLTELMPASFSDKGATINPPYRKLFFRETERKDGGVFLKKLATMLPEGEDAAKTLEQFVSGLKDDLEKKKNVKLGDLGTMRATAQNDYFFVASEDLDIYPEGFGLEPISIKTRVDFTKDTQEEPLIALEREEAEPMFVLEGEEETPAKKVASAKKAAPKKARKKSRGWLVVLIIILLFAILVGLAYYFKENPFVQNILYRLLYTKEELMLLGR